MKNMSRIWMTLMVGATLGVVLSWVNPVGAIPLSNTPVAWDTFSKWVDSNELADPTIAPGPPFPDEFFFSGGPVGQIVSAVLTGTGDASGLYVYVYKITVYDTDPKGHIKAFSVPLLGPVALSNTPDGITSFYISSNVPEWFLSGQGDIAPKEVDLTNTISWSWFGNPISSGKASFIFGFFSPMPPTIVKTNLVDSQVEAEPLAYTPSPEPSAGLLLGIGLLGGLLWRRGLKRSK